MKAAVIGFPIKHSLSPLIYSFLSKQFKITLEYKKIKISEKQIDSFIKVVRNKNYIGFNITIPHKSKIIKYLNTIEKNAKLIGAINVVQKKNQKLIGYNTDVMGILYALKDHNVSLKNKTVFIYGAGGVARAVAVASAKNKTKTVFVYNRTFHSAKKLCIDLSNHYKYTKFVAVKNIQQNCAIYFNATSLGMTSGPAEFSKVMFPKKVLNKKVYAFDCVYSPANTLFLLEMKRRGFQAITGVDMFVWQALFTWKIWFGTSINILKKLKKPLAQIVSSGNK